MTTRTRSVLPIAVSRPRSATDRAGQDRKSTRLNSSHLVISYAVFCLKKKKQHSRLTLFHSRRNCVIILLLYGCGQLQTLLACKPAGTHLCCLYYTTLLASCLRPVAPL